MSTFVPAIFMIDRIHEIERRKGANKSMDQRMKELAHRLVNYCICVQPEEKVLIEAIEADTAPLVELLIDEIYAAGAQPFVQYEIASVNRKLLQDCTEEQIKLQFSGHAEILKQMDATIGIRGMLNAAELSDIPKNGMDCYSAAKSMLRGYRRELKWVLLRYPNRAIAQLANMSLEAYEDFYYSVCNLDYAGLKEKSQPLKALMERTDKVHIVGPGTDLEFSIKDIPVVPCCGNMNIPDGEVYTAPVKESVNGVITFNLPSVFQDICFENIRLVFKDGKIVEADSNHTEELNWILDTDEGSRYTGEFSFGINPNIRTCTNDGSIDEKMWGSIHLTPGNFCDGASNGNVSQIHWDMVLAQTPEYGGGKIYFDDVLVREDGRFVLTELEGLNI